MSQLQERIAKIRELLSEVEGDLATPEQLAFVKNFDALEVPEIVSAIIRYLQPLLLPYEAAIYWHMFVVCPP